MKNTLIALLVAGICLIQSSVASAATPTSSSGKSNGIGFILGEPSGFSFQFLANRPETINGGLAWSFDHWFQIWADYAWHFPHFVSDLIKEYTALDAYVGIGGGIVFADHKSDKFHGNSSVGVLVRVPLGLEYKLNRPPLGFFLELVPGIVFGSSTSGKLQGGIGARFYF